MLQMLVHNIFALFEMVGRRVSWLTQGTCLNTVFVSGVQTVFWVVLHSKADLVHFQHCDFSILGRSINRMHRAYRAQ